MVDAEIALLRKRILELEGQLAQKTRAEDALQESRDLFQAFMGISPVAAYMKDENGVYVYANRTVDRLLCGSQGTWRGKTDEDLLPPEVARVLRENDRRAMESGQPIEIAERLPTPGGERDFLSVKFPFTTQAGRRYLAGMSLDISERMRMQNAHAQLLARERQASADAAVVLNELRQSEARARGLFDSNVIGIVELDEGVIIDANDSFLAMVGHSRAAMKGARLKLREMTPSRYHGILDLAISRMLKEGSFPPFEKELHRSDGTLVPVWIGGAVLKQPPQWRCVSFVLDLTERKQLERQFLSAQKLEHLGRLAGIVAHDFNNLLTAIMGNTSLSLDSLSPGHPAHEPMSEVLRASRLASDLTEQLLAYSGRNSARVQPTALSALVRDISELVEASISRKVAVHLDLEENLPLISADAVQIQQVVMNLVINGAEAIGEGTGVVQISSRRRYLDAGDLSRMAIGCELPPGEYCCLDVSDNGSGMDFATMSRIFEPLFTTKPRGRGLGLAAVIGIVRSHNGGLCVESTPGAGTSFHLVFPATQEQPERAEAKDSVNLWGSGLILVVDDEPSVRRLAEATLKRYGYSVVMAENGQEAVDLFAKEPFNIALVILDMAMPVMNGEETLQKLQEIREDVPVLISSGYNEWESMEELAGYTFLQKPYTAHQLAELVKGNVRTESLLRQS